MREGSIDLVPSPSNALELCVGTLAEMTEGEIYEAVDQYSRHAWIAYLHLRSVVGRVPHYRATFIDEGDVDMIRIRPTLKRNGFEGVISPRPCPTNELRAPLACRHGPHFGLCAGRRRIARKIIQHAIRNPDAATRERG